MAGFGDAIKYLYREFILRDILSFVTPGAIIVLTAFLLFLPEQSLAERLAALFKYSKDMHWLLYIPLFAVFFIVGFAVQCFGRIVGLVRIHLLDKSSFCQRMGIFRCNWQGKDDAYKEARDQTIDFLNATNGVDWATHYHERSVVLKQMCANGSLAIFIAGVFLAVNLCPWPYANLGIVSLTALLLLASLFWAYRDGELALNTIEQKVIGLKKNKDTQKGL